MYLFIISLFVIPAFISGLLLVMPVKTGRVIVISGAILLSIISILLFFHSGTTFQFSVPGYVDVVAAGADIILLLYFGWIGISRRNWKIGLLSLLQLGVLIWVITTAAGADVPQFRVDKLSMFMFILINVISGIIAVFSLKYIEGEGCSSFRKKYFLSVLFWFIAVMNMIVSADNLDYFFLFFELTTLASFLFIGFRNNKDSVENAMTALWMNQVGGLAILVAVLFLQTKFEYTATFSNILAHVSSPAIVLPVALLSMAALIKGAQLPFSKWLLGAMVAPTPVSALLHSSTMVKIAPFIILRLSPALKDTPVAMVLAGLAGFVFLTSAVNALSQDNFKRILAHSTIALLALMILMGAMATPLTLAAALALMLFHGLSKCMLFLNAGILERVFHRKDVSDMDRLAESGPFTSMVVAIGFMSLLLPPFGAFIGKWLSIETLSAWAVKTKIAGALLIVAVACGGAVLSLLYFKVLAVLFTRTGSTDTARFERTAPEYAIPVGLLLTLVLLTALGLPILLTGLILPVVSGISGIPVIYSIEGWSVIIGTVKLSFLPLLIAFFLLPGTILTAMFIRFRNVDRVKEYACGEKIDYDFSAFYFKTDFAVPYFTAAGLLFFVVLILAALV